MLSISDNALMVEDLYKYRYLCNGRIVPDKVSGHFDIERVLLNFSQYITNQARLLQNLTSALNFQRMVNECSKQFSLYTPLSYV